MSLTCTITELERHDNNSIEREEQIHREHAESLIFGISLITRNRSIYD